MSEDDFGGKFAFLFGTILITIAVYMIVAVSWNSGGAHIQAQMGMYRPLLMVPFVIGLWVFGLKTILKVRFSFFTGNKNAFIISTILIILYCSGIVFLEFSPNGAFLYQSIEPPNQDAYNPKPPTIKYASIFFVPFVILFWIFGWKYYMMGWKNDQKDTLAHQKTS